MKLVAVGLFSLFILVACNKQEPITQTDKDLLAEAKENFDPLPDSLIDTKKESKLISLGKKLYFETALSKNNKISCNSCHGLDNFGVDNEKTSPGHDGTRGDRNSPTVYNAAFHLAQFWDGRAEDLAAQAIGPILNPIEHGLPSEEAALKKLLEAGYLEQFNQAFNNDKAFNYKNIGVAIAAFEKTLLTPSRFDDYLKGNINALTPMERKGLKKFISVGCTTCHNGVGIGGAHFMKLGVAEDYPTEDLGRFNVTKDEEDKHVFKVPTLRNITKTQPYFHDGSLATLDEVIPIMAKHQLGEEVSKEDIADIKAFLGSLEAKELIY